MKDDRSLIKDLQTEKKLAGRGAEDKRLIKEFPSNTTTSLEYLLLSITVTFVVADGPLTSINMFSLTGPWHNTSVAVYTTFMSLQVVGLIETFVTQ